MATLDEQMKSLAGQQGGPLDVTGMTPEQIDEAAGMLVTPVDVTPVIDKEKIETKMEPLATIGGFDVGGMGFQTERDLYYAADPWKIKPNVSITETMDFSDPENVGEINKAKFFVDARGTPYEIPADMRIEERIKMADRLGAISYEGDDGLPYDFDFTKIINEMVKVPEDMRTGVMQNGVEMTTLDLTPSDLERIRSVNMVGSLHAMNPELGRPLYAGYLNEILIRNGVDARGRASILRERMADPSMGDFENVLVGATETVGRSILETGLYGIGEGIGLFQMLSPGEDSAITKYQGRQAILDDIFPTLPQILQDRYANKGVFIDLSTAEDLAYTYTGLFPRATRLAAELLSVSKGANTIKRQLSEVEYSNFTRFLEKELTKNPDQKLDDVFDLYMTKRETNPFSPLRFSSKKKIEERIKLAYSYNDASLPVNKRREIIPLQQRQAELKLQESSLVLQQTKSYDAGRQVRLDNLRKQIGVNRYNLTEAERYTSVPEVIRNTRTQDIYMIVGSSTAGHFFGQEFEMVDPALGEFAGLMTGMVASVSSGSVPRGLKMLRFNYANRQAQFADKPDQRATELTRTQRRGLEIAVEELSRAAPEFRTQIEANARRMSTMFDQLEAQGVPRELLEASLPVITDMVTLRHIQDVMKKGLSTGDAFDMDVAQAFQQSHTQLRSLNAEINSVIDRMGGLDMADNEFFEFMRSMSRQGQEMLNSIDNDLRIINERGVGHYLSAITANTDIVDPDGLDNRDVGTLSASFPQAVNSLLRKGIFDTEKLDRPTVEKSFDTAMIAINDSLVSSAAQMSQRLGVPDNKATALAPAMAAAPKLSAKSSIHDGMNGSTLFAFQLEAAHELRYAQASLPYRIFDDPDSVRLSSANMGELSNDITVNVHDIFVRYSDQAKTALTAAGVAQSEIDKIIVEVSDPIFGRLAKRQGVSVDQILKDLKEDLQDQDPEKYRFRPGRSLQAQVAEYLQDAESIDGFDANMFRMTPMQLREFDMHIRNQAHKARNRGQGGVADALYSMSDNDIEAKFGQFTVDGQPAGEIQIVTADGTETLVDYFNRVGADWRRYKEDFHDKTGGGMIPDLLFNNRTTLIDGPSAEFPTGVATKKLPSMWLKADDLFGDNAPVYMAAVNRSMGKEILVDGRMERRLVDGDPFTQGQQAIVKVTFAEWATSGIKNGTLSPDDIAKAAAKLEENITMVSADGKVVPLINAMSAVDNHVRFSKKTIGDARYNQEMEKASALISGQLEAATEKATELRDGLNDAIEVTSRLTSGPMGTQDIATTLIGGGMERYSTIRSSMLRLTNDAGGNKYTAGQVDEILANSYILGMRRALFTRTGSRQANVETSIDGKVTTTFSDILVENPQALMKFLGETEEEMRVARRILNTPENPDRYETMRAIAGVLTELTANPLAKADVQVRGIPRALSVESYISRIYAINRGVVRPQYVGTEAVLQQARFKKHEFLTAILTDPKLGRAFLEIARTEKPLSPERNAEFTTALIQHLAYFSQVYQADTKEIVDPAGRKFTLDATTEDMIRMGYPEGIIDNLPGRGSLAGPSATRFGGLDVMMPGVLTGAIR